MPEKASLQTEKTESEIKAAIVRIVADVAESLQSRHYHGNNSCHCALNEAHYNTRTGHYPSCYTHQAADKIFREIFGQTGNRHR